MLLKSSIFFADYCLGLHVAEVLRGANLHVEIHKDHFKDDEEDVVWLKAVGARNWIVLTKDKAIRRKPAELQAVIDSKVRMFTLPSGNMTGDEMAQLYVRNLPKIGRFIKDHGAPFIARVSDDGVRIAYPAPGPDGGGRP